nr:PREDICTED: uncharacterized protein LOC107983469 isoform X2 [Anolis carolinensis]|eukprot:XP_016852713.1 PREDICTED: uncharacterized protein LOC107983469 isoform X2 [Anolis carolinensis]
MRGKGRRLPRCQPGANGCGRAGEEEEEEEAAEAAAAEEGEVKPSRAEGTSWAGHWRGRRRRRGGGGIGGEGFERGAQKKKTPSRQLRRIRSLRLLSAEEASAVGRLHGIVYPS